jgi:hypothetical protein
MRILVRGVNETDDALALSTRNSERRDNFITDTKRGVQVGSTARARMKARAEGNNFTDELVAHDTTGTYHLSSVENTMVIELRFCDHPCSTIHV